MFWSGDVPEELQRMVEERPHDVGIEVRAVPYSKAELDAAVAAIGQHGLLKEYEIVGVDPDVTTGLTISTSRADRFSDDQIAFLRKVTTIDALRIDYAAPPAVGYDRDNDSAPWKGGIRTRHLTGSGTSLCSTAFAVILNGTGRLLSARHCNPAANAAVQDGAEQPIAPGGTSVSARIAIDSLLIDPTASPATVELVYDGGWATNSRETVKNWASNWVNDPVCSSGGSTGTRCGEVYDDSDYVTMDGVSVNVIQARAPSGAILGGEGDSGGPFFKRVTGGVQARGVLLGPDLTGGHTEITACGSTNPDAGVIYCSRWINYVPISTILNTWEATLEVG